MVVAHPAFTPYDPSPATCAPLPAPSSPRCALVTTRRLRRGGAPARGAPVAPTRMCDLPIGPPRVCRVPPATGRIAAAAAAPDIWQRSPRPPNVRKSIGIDRREFGVYDHQSRAAHGPHLPSCHCVVNGARSGAEAWAPSYGTAAPLRPPPRRPARMLTQIAQSIASHPVQYPVPPPSTEHPVPPPSTSRRRPQPATRHAVWTPIVHVRHRHVPGVDGNCRAYS